MHWVVRIGWVALGSATVAGVTGGQTPAPPAGQLPTGKMSGVLGLAADSVHGGPLTDAIVEVEGTGREGTSDSTGRFRVDSVPPGTYRLALFHPLLDTLGLSIETGPITLPAGRYAVVGLATPRGAALAERLCVPDARTAGPAALVGRVLQADSDLAVPGARVMLSWEQLELNKKHVRRHGVVREGTTDSSGYFRVCGIPPGVNGTVRAIHTIAGSDEIVSTADVPVAFGPDTLHVAALRLAGRGRSGSASAVGRVTVTNGTPVPGVTISLAQRWGESDTATGPVAETDTAGAFRLGGLPSGTQALLVRKIGYVAVAVPIELAAHMERHIDITLKPAPPALPPVVVKSKREKGLALVGFTERQRAGLGHYLTAEQIAEKMPRDMPSVFTMIPGLHVDYSTNPPTVKGTRTYAPGGGCVRYYVDDVPYKEQVPGDIDLYLRPDELSAVEVYNSADVPAAYQSSGSSECTVIIIWTKTKVGG